MSNKVLVYGKSRIVKYNNDRESLSYIVDTLRRNCNIESILVNRATSPVVMMVNSNSESGYTAITPGTYLITRGDNIGEILSVDELHEDTVLDWHDDSEGPLRRQMLLIRALRDDV